MTQGLGAKVPQRLLTAEPTAGEDNTRNRIFFGGHLNHIFWLIHGRTPLWYEIARK
jgi:hypothetical protein